MYRNVTALSTLTLCALLNSCAHQLEVVNLKQYKLSPTEGPGQKIALLPYAGPPEAEELFTHVVAALRGHPSVDQVRTNWSWEKKDPSFEPDVVVKVDPSINLSGSGWNYLITFPGFLVFAPAWNGYVYHGNVATALEVFDVSTRKALANETIATDYSLRHADPGRTFWAEMGWWTPGYGAVSAISGFYMISYDTDATEPFHEVIRRPYGDYVAEHIVRSALDLARGESTTALPTKLTSGSRIRREGKTAPKRSSSKS